MRVYSLASLIFLLLLLPQLGQAQKRNSLVTEAKVDSVFKKHFASIGKRAGTDKSLLKEDLYFIQVLSFLSGIKDYTLCYGSMALTKSDMLSYKKWYAAHSSQVTWDNLQRGFALMSISLETLVSDSSDIADARRIKALESLRIK